MFKIKDTKDFEALLALQENYKKKIKNIKDERTKENYVLCAKLMNEVETEIYEKYDYEDLRTISQAIISDYLLFGDIYSNIGDKENALKYYNHFHYSIYNIKSPYRDKSIKLLSFRTISPYSLSDLINNEITVCSPTLMNDPFDSIALSWASSDNSKNLGKGFRKTHEFFIESYNPYKIRCFSKNNIEDKNNILMWSHYADNHRGFCIEYTFTPDFIEQRNFKNHVFSLILDVDYSNDNDDVLKKFTINTQQAFASKAECWKYENEVRLLYYNPDCISKYGMISLGNSLISAIYFGYKCSEDNIRLIKKILGDKIRYYQMKQVNGKIYTLEPIER